MILFVDATVRKGSRTGLLAKTLLDRLKDEVVHLRLEDVAFDMTDEKYLEKREALIAKGAFDDDMFALAGQFAKVDTIVIAAPYWDLSFPARLKQYMEAVNVVGVTFEYTPEGTPRGLCHAGKLYYVTTAGGKYVPEEFGYGYIKALAQNFYGIKDTELIMATGLDVMGADTDAIMQEAIRRIETSVPV